MRYGRLTGRGRVAELTDADRTDEGRGDGDRAKRLDLLDAVVRSFPMDIRPAYGKGAQRYEALFEARPLDELHGLFTGRMAIAMRKWYEILDRALKPHGLGLRHWQALFNVAVHDPGETLTSIASRLGVPNATLVRILDDLEKSGLIERHVDEKDRRSKRLDLTSAGESVFSTLFGINHSLRRQFLQGISQSELSLMVSAADVMNRNLDRLASAD